MYFTIAAACLALAGTAVVDALSIRGDTRSAQKLMQNARRIQNNGYYNNGAYYYGGQGQQGQYNGNNQQQIYAEMDDESMWFLSQYSIKLLTCIANEQVVNYNDGEKSMESSTVIFRLCPAESCNSTGNDLGCDAGYGDFAVGINTYVNAFIEMQSEIFGDELIYYNAMGEEFNVGEYAQCAEYNLDENQYQQNGYYYQNGYNQQQNWYNGQQQQNGGAYYQNGYQQQYASSYQQQNANAYQSGYEQTDDDQNIQQYGGAYQNGYQWQYNDDQQLQQDDGNYYQQSNGYQYGYQQNNDDQQMQQDDDNYYQKNTNGYQYGYYQNDDDTQTTQQNTYQYGYETHDDDQQTQQNGQSSSSSYKQFYYNGGNRKLENNNYNKWYIGPGCTSDGMDIRFALYRDQYCTYAPGTMMKDINYGWQNGMPFEDGGLVNTQCQPCMIRDEDYNQQITPFCADPFRSALARCEANMTSYSYMGPNTQGCDYITNLEYSVYGNSLYGTFTEEIAEDNLDETLQEQVLRFIEKMNTRQTRTIIGAIVLFSLCVCMGATLISCMCFKKRKARRRARALVSKKDVFEGIAPAPAPPKASVVDLVRTTSKRVTNAVASAAIGTKVVVANAAAGAVAAVTRSQSKKKEVETPEYTDMEDDIEKNEEGSYQAPAASEVAAPAAVERVVPVSEAPPAASVKSVPVEETDAEVVASVKSKSSVANAEAAAYINSKKSVASATSAVKSVPTTIETSNLFSAKTENPSTSGSILDWFGLGGNAKEENKSEVDHVAKVSILNASVVSKKLSSQMEDYLSQKFT